MLIKTATYWLVDGGETTVEYDADAPCWYCGLPVIEASMGGTVVCPWCDMGKHRDGRDWTYREMIERGKNYQRNRDSAAPSAATGGEA